MNRCLWTLLIAVLFASQALAEDAPAAKEKAANEKAMATATKAELEKKFQEQISGATLVGHYIVHGEGNAPALKEERYTIQSISKIEGDLWLFKAQIKYGKNDVTLPLPLPVLWAGDTPVITLDKFPVPGFGSFTARVMIYDGKYVGTWDGANHGGLLFGRIEKEKK